jgi:hypothetical protein
MTSQVVVYNMNGIAIASDTVVTSTSDAGSKTTANAEKIYELGPKHKVLAVHYGGTALNDVSHQFHFAEWALTLDEPLPRLTDYVHSYIEWTGKSKFHTPSSEAGEMRGALNNHFAEIKRRMNSFYDAWEPKDSTTEAEDILELEQANQKIAEEGLVYLKALSLYEGMTEAKSRVAIKAAGIDLSEMIDSFFEGFRLNARFKSIIKSSAPYVLARAQSMPWDSFMAFTGYGLNDPFPGTQVLTCRSIYADQLIFDLEEKTEISPGPLSAEISRFAQGDAIEAFLKGYNTDIINGFSWAIEKHVRELAGDTVAPEIATQVAANAVEYIENHSWKRYVQPILRQVAGMNLFGMAELARTLVSIQATFSEAQDGPVSVGGVIEVVTIDRVNGVRWKNRLPR